MALICIFKATKGVSSQGRFKEDPPPYFVNKDEIKEERRAGRASKTKPSKFFQTVNQYIVGWKNRFAACQFSFTLR